MARGGDKTRLLIMEKRSALLIVDMQKEDGFTLADFPEAILNTSLVLATARRAEMPVIFTRHVNKADGTSLPNGEPVNEFGQPETYLEGSYRTEVLDELRPLETELVIDKARYSAFFATHLDEQLSALGVDHLVICGVMTDVCIMGTVFDAFYKNYHMTLVSDACTATTRAAHYASLHIMSNWIYGLDLISTKNFLLSAEGKPFVSLKAETPDHLAHEPEEFVKSIGHLKTTFGI
jgi:biuret amidohydrolase